MILSPKIYAQALVEALKDKKDAKIVAKNFWNKLQRDNQTKNLPAILEALDKEYAKKENLTLVKVISDYKLEEKELEEIKKKVEQKLTPSSKENFRKNVKIILKNVVKPNISGIIIEANGKVLDLSLSGKIQKLRKAFSK